MMIELHTWEDIAKSLQTIGEIAPQFLKKSIIVGGGAALCYNAMLLKSGDTAFPPRLPEKGQTNYSKDLDFTNVFFEDYEKEFSQYLQHDPYSNRKFLSIQGVRIGFLQFGCTFIPEEEIVTGTKFQLVGSEFQINVLDPVSLFREKSYLIEKGRGKPNDSFHREIAKTYILLQYKNSALKPKKKEILLSRIKDKAPELLKEINRIQPLFESAGYPIQSPPSDRSLDSR